MVYYVIDGYNLLYRIDEYRNLVQGTGLEAGRERLERDCREYSFSKNIRVVIIYDSSEMREGEVSYQGNLEIIYSGKSKEADQMVVIQAVRLRERGDEVVVVSDDNWIRDEVKKCEIAVKTTGEFFRLLMKHKRFIPNSEEEEKPRDVDFNYWLEQFKRREG